MGSDKIVEKRVENVCNERDILFNLFIIYRFIIYRKLERIEKNIYDLKEKNKHNKSIASDIEQLFVLVSQITICYKSILNLPNNYFNLLVDEDIKMLVVDLKYTTLKIKSDIFPLGINEINKNKLLELIELLGEEKK